MLIVKDQLNKPLKVLDIFVYSEKASLGLSRGVVLGFIKGEWVQWMDIDHIEGERIRLEPPSYYKEMQWRIKDLISRKRVSNLIRIDRWAPSKEFVEEIRCPELVDIILKNL